MTLAAYAAVPERMSLTNLVTSDVLGAQYNPEELNETIGAAYSKQVVLGLSHTVKQFTNTEDLGVTFTLIFSSFESKEAHQQNLAARRFLHAVCYPRVTGVGGIRSGGAPRVLFVWPQLFALTCVVTKVAFKHSQFNLRGAPVRMSAAVTLEEIRDEFLSMEDVFEVGTERAAGLVDGTRYGGEF